MATSDSPPSLVAALTAVLLVLGTGCASPESSDKRLQPSSTSSASRSTRDRPSTAYESLGNGTPVFAWQR